MKQAWVPHPLKHLLTRNDGGTWGNDPNGVDDVVVLRSTDISLGGGWSIDDPAVRAVEPSDRVRHRLKEGDLVVVKSSGSAQHLGKAAIVTQEVAALNACFANFVQRLRPSDDADPRYLWYLLNSHFGASQMAILGTTTTGLRNLNGEILGAIQCPGPPLSDQRTIADYIDSETARIDALIAKKQRMIELLDERRAVCLAEAFNGPATALTRLKYLLNQSPCYGVLVPQFADDGVPFVRVNDLLTVGRGGVPQMSIEPDQSREYSRTAVAAGDVLVSVVGSIDKVAVVPPALAGANVARAVCRLVPRSGVPSDLLALLLRSSDYLRQARLATGSDTAQPTLNMGDLANFVVHFPSATDSESFSRELRQVLQPHDNVRALIDRHIALLHEGRQGLITAAVTGELGVPGVAA
jgi:type I restriction enzyme S subunit